MDTYHVLLAEDDAEIRAGISRAIDWNGLGFSLVGEAENGAEALELAEQLRPDVVLTDIQMPFMTGLELCSRLRQSLPAAQLVVFSGFDEFEYARRALSMDVFEYILKPISAYELSDVLTRLRARLDRQRLERWNVESLQRRYEQSLPILRELFYVRLMDGRIPPEEIETRAQRYDLCLPQGLWTVALVRAQRTVQAQAQEQREFALLSIKEFFQEEFSLSGASLQTVLYNDMVALLISLENTQLIYPLLEQLQRLCTLSGSGREMSVTVGVAVAEEGCASIAACCKQARAALDYRILLGENRVIYMGDLEAGHCFALSFEPEDQRRLDRAIRLDNTQEITQVLEKLMARISQSRLSLPQCHLFVQEIVISLIKLARAGGVEPEDVFGAGFSGMVEITDFHSLTQLNEWLCERCLKLSEMLGRRRSDSAWRMVEQAKAFVKEQFANSELSVEMVCEQLHLSAAYFSTLFKKETGVSFITYLTKIRMEHAARLLRETDEKTYLIAEQTGYTDPNYFSYVFKRHHGLTPSKFRNGTT